MGLKIFSSFLAVFIIFILSFLTFFSNSQSDISYYSQFKIPQNGLFSILKDKTGDFVEMGEKKNSQILLERFDFIDKIFFSKKDSYKRQQIGNTTGFKISNGKYFMSFSYPKKYEISGSGFTLNFVGPIKLYINSENLEKIDIFSFDNVVELTLFGLDDGKEKTKVYSYPHMLLTFNMRLNKILKNSDLFRISQLNDIVYVNENLYKDDYKLQNFQNLDNYFFKSVLNYLSSEYKNSKNENLLLEKSFNNMSYEYIKKYFYIFVNDNKKIAYYKDLIYMSLLKVYLSPDSNNGIFSDIELYYENLKNLSIKDYNEMLKVLVYFKSKFLLDNNIKNINTEIKYDKILSSIFSFQKMDGNYMLYYIFNLYDLGNKNNFFDGLISFSDDYFKLNGLKIQEDKILGYNETKNIKLGYYISFLENIIKSYLIIDGVNIDDVKGIFNVFNKYALLSDSVYSNTVTDKKKTSIVMHVNLLKDMSEYFRKNFFEQELEKGVILVRKKGLEIDFDMISLFEKSFNILYDFYIYNKKIFDENIEKDYLYVKEYDLISLNFVEFINALKNYDKYKLEKSELYSIKTVGGIDTKKIIYTTDDIKNYFLTFNGVNKDTIKVKSDESGNYYNVKFNIGSTDFSFELYPYNNYSIKNIYIDGTKKNLTYSLNVIKEKMDERYTSSSNPEEKNRNDFNNFFINTFLKTSNSISSTSNYPDTTTNNNTQKEDLEILVFKRDKLLGPKGEFSSIKEFADLNSDNIIVTINNGKISIKLKDIKTKFNFAEGREILTYGAYIDSNYYIGDNEHYFSNLKLRLYKSIKEGTRIKDYFGLGDEKYIKVIGNIGIVPFKDYLNSITSYYNYIIHIDDILTDDYGPTEITATSGKIIKFSFKYNESNYEVSLLGSSIILIKKDGENISSKAINYTDFKNRINLLIK